MLLSDHVKPAQEALIRVHGPDGSLHQIPLGPGLAGRRRFTKTVRKALMLPYNATLEFNFEVMAPWSGAFWGQVTVVSLSGI